MNGDGHNWPYWMLHALTFCPRRRLRTLCLGFMAIALTACGGGGGAASGNNTSEPDPNPTPGGGLPPPVQANQTPFAGDDQVTSGTSGEIIISVLANDTDPDGDALSLLSVGVPTVGSAAIDDNGTVNDGTDDRVRLTLPTGFNGSLMLTYTVQDPGGASAEGIVRVDVGQSSGGSAANSPPLALDDAQRTTPGTGVLIDVLVNDTDANNDALSLLSVGAAATGIVSRDDGGTPLDATDDRVLYQPAPGFSGADEFEYSVSDGIDSAKASVLVTVRAATVTPPQQICGQVMLGPVREAEVSLFALDAGGNASGAPIATLQTDANGQWCADLPDPRPDYLVVSTDGRYFDPADSGNSTSGLREIDLTGATLEGILFADADTTAVTPVSSALVRKIRAQSFGSDYAQVAAVVRAQASDAYGLDVFAIPAVNPLDPAEMALPSREFAMMLGGSAGALNRLAVALGEEAPDAGLLSAFVEDLTDCSLDGQSQGAAVTVTSLSPPQALPGNVSLNLEILRFRNNQFAAYNDTPLVQINSAPCLVSAVIDDTQAPRFVTLPADITLSDPVGTGVQSDDGRLQPFVDAVVVTDNRPQPVEVVLQLATGAALPALFPVGVTRVVFVATDAAGNQTISAERLITVTSSLPPDTEDDDATTTEDVDVTIDILANDIPRGLPLDPASVRVQSVVGAASVVVDTSNGSLVVTPSPDTFGTVTITYDVANTDGLRGATATVTLTVTPANNDAPVAQNDSASVAENNAVAINVLANDSDPDEGGLNGATVELETAPANGVAVVDGATRRIVYTPAPDFDGTDSFRYRVRDTSGRLSLDALVSVQVTGVNQPPAAVGRALTLNEDGNLEIELDASDPEGRLDANSATIATAPVSGTLTPVSASLWRYTPDADFFGSDTFTFTYADIDGLISAPATVTLTIVSVNDVPTLADDTVTTSERVPVLIDVLTNDSDVEGAVDATTVEIVTVPANGTANVEATGQVNYVSVGQFNGAESFEYRVADGDGVFGAPATVVVTVAAVDDLPAAGDDAVIVLEGASVVIDVTSNDTDPENALDLSTVTLVDVPTVPVAVDPLSGAITVDASMQPAGREILTYTVSDVGGNLSNLATVVIDVWPATDGDFDGVASDIEIAVGTDPDAGDSRYVHIDPAADPGLSDGNSWATAFVSPAAASTAGALNGSAGVTTFMLLADNAAAADPWPLAFDDNCDDLVIVGSVGYLTDSPQRNGDDEWATALAANSGSRPLELRNCNNVHVYGVRIADGSGVATGGGALVEAATVVLNDPEFEDNTATDAGGALALTVGDGVPAATLTVNDGVFIANAVDAPDGVDGRGGALHAQSGTTLMLDGTRFVRNRIIQAGIAGDTGGGGGLHSDNATLSTTDVTFAANRSDSVGGGFVLRGATGNVLMRHTNISGNEAQNRGGGAYLGATRNNVIIANSLLTANYAQVGGGIYTEDALDTAITNFTGAYNFASDGGGLWVSNGSPRLDDNVLMDNTGLSSANTVGGSVAALLNLNANNNVTDEAWAGFFGTNNLTADARFTSGYYLDHDPGNLSPAIDHSVTFQSDDPTINLAARFTNEIGAAPDGGALDAGYHYEAPSVGVVDAAPGSGAQIDPGGQYHVIRLRPTVGGVAAGPGRRVFVSGIDDTAQPRLYRYTTAFSDPLGTGRSTPAVDLGDGSYEFYVQAPFNTDFFLDLWIDTLVGPALVRYSARIDST